MHSIHANFTCMRHMKTFVRDSLPTHVLSSCPSCRPADGQRQRISPSTSSQPYWQWAREHVLESAHINAARAHFQTRTEQLLLYFLPCKLGTHWSKSRPASRCNHWDSSTCNYRKCSCSDARKAEVSDHTRLNLEKKRKIGSVIFTWKQTEIVLNHQIKQIKRLH